MNKIIIMKPKTVKGIKIVPKYYYSKFGKINKSSVIKEKNIRESDYFKSI
jgi:hypothetical protein